MSSPTTHSWWANSPANARRTAVGATALAVVLALICAYIWWSPSDLASNVKHSVTNAAGSINPFESKNAKLKKQIAQLQAQLKASEAGRIGNKSKLDASTATDQGRITSLKSQITSLNTSLDKAWTRTDKTDVVTVTHMVPTSNGDGPHDVPQNPLTEFQTHTPQGPDNNPRTVTMPSPHKTTKPSTSPSPSPTPRSSQQAPAPTTSPTSAPTTQPSSSPSPTTTPAPTTSASPSPTPTATATAAPAPITTVTKADIMNATTRYWGLYTEQAPFAWAETDDAASKVGYEPNMVGYFQGWDKPFRPDAVESAWEHNQIPVMTWESRPIDDANNVISEPDYSLGKILDGSFDSYLDTYAQQIAALKLPLVIRLDQEMNGTWYPWSEDDGHGGSINGNSPGQFAQMWQYVHNIFQQYGANQYVIWDWSPNVITNLTSTHKTEAYLQSLYPGDADVDWVGLSGYLRPPYNDSSSFSFADTYSASLDQLRDIAPGKKIILSEIGASDTGDTANPAGYKARWITNLFNGLASPTNQDVLGFVWFDQAVTSYTNGTQQTNDWRIDSSGAALSAFKTGLAQSQDDFDLVPVPATQ